MKYAIDTNIFIDGFRNEEAQAEVLAFLNRALPFTYLSAVVMQELAAGARTTAAVRELQRGVFAPFERRRRVFARIKAGLILLGGFLVTSIRATPMPPEIDGINYASRAKAPVLIMNSRHDAIFPYETAEVPLYRLLGAAPDHKRHLVFPGGHSSFGWTNELIKEGLDWLDRWFGPPMR